MKPKLSTIILVGFSIAVIAVLSYRMVSAFSTDWTLQIQGGKAGVIGTITGSPLVTFLDNGNVGIGTGTTDPTQKLSIIGNTYISGNVGIGVPTPSQKLDINGYLKASGVCFGSDCKTAWSQMTSPWEKKTKTYTITGPACSGNTFRWTYQNVNLPRFTTDIDVSLAAGSAWGYPAGIIQVMGYNSGGTYVRLGYAGRKCVPDASYGVSGVTCSTGYGNSYYDSPSLPGSNYYTVYVQLAEWCYGGGSLSSTFTATYFTPVPVKFPNSSDTISP